MATAGMPNNYRRKDALKLVVSIAGKHTKNIKLEEI